MSMTKLCPQCDAWYFVYDNDPDIELEPYPHITCKCGFWIPMF